MKTQHRLLVILLLCVSFLSDLNAQTTVPVGKVVNVPVDGGGTTFHAILSLPDDYNSSSGNYPLLIFCHGVGEAGSDLSTLYNSTGAGGLAYYLEHNLFPSSITNPADGKAYKFIVLCPQAPTFSTSGKQLDYMVNYMISKYRVDVTRLYLTALSAGGAGLFDYTTHNGFTPSHDPTAIVPMSMDIGVPQQSMINQTIADNVPVWGFGSETDVLGINTHIYVTGAYGGNGGTLTGLGSLGRFTSYTGGHCCWNQFYDPSYTEKINGTSMNIYQWMLQAATPSGAPSTPATPAPPTANAGASQTLTLPLSSITLDGSASKGATGHTIASYSWAQTSGPAGAVLLSAGAVTTSVTALTQGTYQFQLTVTDDQGQKATATTQVTIDAAAAPPPTAPVTTPPNNPAPSNPAIPAGGKRIVKVGAGEYFTSFLTDENKIYATLWNNTAYQSQFIAFPLSNIVDVDGAQYTNICRSSSGAVYVIGKAQAGGGPSVVNYNTDVFGRPFTGNSKAFGWFQSYLTIRSDSVYYFGKDQLGINGGKDITLPMPLGQPTGKKVSKITVMDISADIKALIMVMCTDGTVWQYNRGSATPVQVTLPAPALDITSVGRAAYVVQTATDLLAWGPYASYVGLTDGTTKATSMLSKWTGVGAKFPFKQIVGSWNNLHIVDASDNMFACGDNMQGEIGNGIQYGKWASYTFGGTLAAFAWSWLRAELMQAPVQIPGKFTNLCGGNSIAFYYYVQDLCQNNWYSWGRNKQYALANGHRMSNDDVYPDWGCVPAPTLVSPSTVTWIPDAVFNPAALQAPYANAGIGQCINSTTVNLSAALSSQQGGTITGYSWTMVSGTGGTITTPKSANTTVTGLTSGTYCFQVTVTNNGGMTTTDKVYITVNAGANKAPVADGGGDKTIVLPTSSVTLNGSGTDADGTIASFFWTKLSGPAQFSILSPKQAQTTIDNLVQGVYTFQLTVTDNQGAKGTSVVTVTVNAAPVVPGPPSANAGNDQSITLPSNSVNLTGSGTETNGTISGYSWSQLSGPAPATIGTANQAATTVNGLVQGVYTFQLTITDNSGKTATDVIKVTVKAAPVVPGPPVVDAGTDQTITLPTNSTNLQATASETNGTISTYKWTQVSGPSTSTISIANQEATTVSGLIQGVYTFQVTVTDNLNVTTTDVVKVTVNAAPAVPGPPSASGGNDQSITLPASSVNLSGSGSETNGTITSYKWVQLSGPAASAIGNANQAATTVSGLVQGVYTFQLTVTDNSNVTATDVVKVTVNPASPVPGLPVVDAGTNQSITLPANSTNLAATASEANGTITTYKWIQLSGPVASTIGTDNKAATTVSGLVQGVYTFQITVTDNSNVTATDVVKVTVNAAPVVPGLPSANAGTDHSITLPTSSAGLLGSGSETNGTITSYKWSQVSGPSTATINADNQPNTTVNGLVQGVYIFQLTVTDNSNVTATDQVKITVNAAPVVPGTPIVDAGANQTIVLPASSASLSATASETNGTIANYKWTQLSGPSTAAIGTATQAATTVSGLVQGVYTFQITVTDNSGVTATDVVKVTVNAVPIVPGKPNASAGNDQTITLPASSALLTGLGTETNGSIVSYLWTQVSGPSTVSIAQPDQSQIRVTKLVQGVYIFQLMVTDNSGVTATDQVQVTVKAPAAGQPTANAGPGQVLVLPKNSTSLAGSGSQPAGSIQSYKWIQVSGPSTSTIATPTQATTTIGGLVEGGYIYQLTVTDNFGGTATATVKVTVNAAPPNVPPVANAGSDQTVAKGSNVDLDGTASYDPDGSIVKYSWYQVSGTGGVTINNSGTSNPPVYGLAPGTYVFQLTVTDNLGATGSDKVTIVVTGSGSTQPSSQNPVANAGKDTTVIYPGGNNATLNGSASYSPGGQLVSYSWRQISGPTAANMDSPVSDIVEVSQLFPGDYKFALTVTGNNNLSASDTVKVHVQSNTRHGGFNIRLYPNPVPAGQVITVQGETEGGGQIKFNVIDGGGRVLKEIELDNEGGTFRQQIQTNGWARGVYFLRVQFAARERPQIYRFVVD